MRQAFLRWFTALNSLPFETLIGLLALVSALNLLLHPHLYEQPPYLLLVHPVDYIWTAMYGISGLLLILGIASRRRNIEVGGLLMLIGGVSIQATMLALSFPFGAIVIAFSTYLFVIGASVVRIVTLLRHKDVIPITFEQGETDVGD